METRLKKNWQLFSEQKPERFRYAEHTPRGGGVTLFLFSKFALARRSAKILILDTRRPQIMRVGLGKG
jgi:hypothetical protein